MNKIFKLFILIFDSHYTDVVMQNLISFFVKVLKYLAVIFCSIWVFIVVLFGIYLSVGAAIAANHGEQSIAAINNFIMLNLNNFSKFYFYKAFFIFSKECFVILSSFLLLKWMLFTLTSDIRRPPIIKSIQGNIP